MLTLTCVDSKLPTQMRLKNHTFCWCSWYNTGLLRWSYTPLIYILCAAPFCAPDLFNGLHTSLSAGSIFLGLPSTLFSWLDWKWVGNQLLKYLLCYSIDTTTDIHNTQPCREVHHLSKFTHKKNLRYLAKCHTMWFVHAAWFIASNFLF